MLEWNFGILLLVLNIVFVPSEQKPIIYKVGPTDEIHQFADEHFGGVGKVWMEAKRRAGETDEKDMKSILVAVKTDNEPLPEKTSPDAIDNLMNIVRGFMSKPNLRTLHTVEDGADTPVHVELKTDKIIKALGKLLDSNVMTRKADELGERVADVYNQF